MHKQVYYRKWINKTRKHSVCCVRCLNFWQIAQQHQTSTKTKCFNGFCLVFFLRGVFVLNSEIVWAEIDFDLESLQQQYSHIPSVSLSKISNCWAKLALQLCGDLFTFHQHASHRAFPNKTLMLLINTIFSRWLKMIWSRFCAVIFSWILFELDHSKTQTFPTRFFTSANWTMR